jgi:hypothetical protein
MEKKRRTFSPCRSLVVSTGAWMFTLVALTSATLAQAESRCANQVLDTIPSPDGRFKAVVFLRACGQPARFSTQVSILKRNRPLANVAGNVFMCAGSYGLSPAGPGGRRVAATWEAKDLLVIHYPSEAEVFAAKTAQKRIRVRYEPEDAAPLILRFLGATSNRVNPVLSRNRAD